MIFILGGYALVFIAYDVKTNKEYALKVKYLSSKVAIFYLKYYFISEVICCRR